MFCRHLPILLALGAVAASATTANAQPKTYQVADGVTLTARAYTDHSGSLKDASRYDLALAKTPDDGTKWDFTLQDEPKYHRTGSISGATSPANYNNNPTATLHATLHQYEIYEERVTFADLGLGMEEGTPPDKHPFLFGPKSPAQFVRLSEPQTRVTPSGIAITLPVQGAQTALGGFNGPVDNALFVNIDVSPDQREVILPASTFYKKYGKPVTIQLKTPAPNSMIWDSADNTFNTIVVYMPNVRTFKRLDKLTLIVRQRVELQTIPVALEVPVERPAKTK